jgi:hypothetical protein
MNTKFQFDRSKKKKNPVTATTYTHLSNAYIKEILQIYTTKTIHLSTPKTITITSI